MTDIVEDFTWTTEPAAHSGDGRTFIFNDSVQRIILAIIFVIIFVVGLIGNGLTILAVLLSRKLRTITNVFVVNLAVADIFTCSILPWTVVALVSFDGWPLPEWICAGAGVVLYTCGGCSLYSLATIALNRFFIITRPRARYCALYTKRNIAIILTICWSIPLAVSLIPPLCGLGELGYSFKYKTCSYNTSHPLSDYNSMLQAAVLYPVPLVVIFTCYIKIYLHTRRHMKTMMTRTTASGMQDLRDTSKKGNQETKLQRRQVEITKNLFYVVCAFGLCASPYCVSLMIPPSDPLIPWTGAILLVNSCINPFIYATKHPHFKQVFGFMLRCQCSSIPEQASIIRTISSMRSSRWSKGDKRMSAAAQQNGHSSSQITTETSI